MAGLGAKLFSSFTKLTASQVNGYLMDQSIMRFADATARDAAFGGAGEPSLTGGEGMHCYLDDTNVLQQYTGSAWVEIASSDGKAPRGVMSFVEKTTSTTPVSTETVILTLPSFTAVASRYYRVTAFFPYIETTGGGAAFHELRIRKGTTTAGTQLQASVLYATATGSADFFMAIQWVGTLTAGAQQMVCTFTSSASSTVYALATLPMQMTIEDIGAV